MKKDLKEKKKWYWAYTYWVCALCGKENIFRERIYNPKKRGWHDQGFEVCGSCEISEFL